MTKVGIVIKSLYSSQLAYYLIKAINEFYSKNYNINFIIFVRDLVIPCVDPNCSVMRWEELWGFDGHVITTDIESTMRVMITPGPKSVTHYVYDLDWTDGVHKHIDLSGVYQNPDINLVARNEEYAKIIGRLWNRNNVEVLGDFKLDELLKLVGNLK
jgi:hypothetical protein